jgi:hypothetical protein
MVAETKEKGKRCCASEHDRLVAELETAISNHPAE